MSAPALEKTLKDLDEMTIQLMNENLLPGTVVGVVENGKLIYAKGTGLANIEKHQPMTPETVFRIASISKTFTAVGLMQLWELGKFQLDDPVNDYLKDFKILHRDPHAPPVTFRHMLTHTAGIGEVRDYRDLFLMLIGKGEGNTLNEAEVPSIPKYLRGRLEPDAYPGQKWAYANLAFGALGQAIEDISGEPFPEYMRKHVFEPLGMQMTSYQMTDQLKAGMATGYQFKKGNMLPTKIDFFPDRGAGSVSSNLNEMALYMAALMNGGSNEHGSILKPGTLQMMMSPQYREHPRLQAMGLCFFLTDDDGHLMAGHGGTLDGYESSMMVMPQDKLGMLIWSNKNTLALEPYVEKVLRGMFDLPEHSKRIPVPGVAAPVHLYQEMVGSYGPPKGFLSNARFWMMTGGEMEVYVEKNKLMLRGLASYLKKGIQLSPLDPNDPLLFEGLFMNIPVRVAFKRNMEGFIDQVDISVLMFFRLFKRSKNESVRYRVQKILTAVATLLLGIIGLKIMHKRKEKCQKHQ
jgi:CubicO group peptidase (beta-lactamase class C family)